MTTNSINNPIPYILRSHSYNKCYHKWDCWRVTELIKAIAITIFSAFTALMFSRGREIWTRAITGKDTRLINIAKTINRDKKPLFYFELSKNDLRRIMPYLEYANFNLFNLIDEFTNQEIQELIDSSPFLKQLSIYSNRITSLRIPSGLEKACLNINALTNLDLSNATALTKLDCSWCRNLATLNLSNARALTKLDCSWCRNLTTLNLSNATALTELNCSWSFNLAQLNLSNARGLTNFECPRCNQLTFLDLSDCINLRFLNCSECSQLSSLNLSNCIYLTALDCSHCPQLTSLHIEALPRCRVLLCRNTPNLTQLPQLPQTVQIYNSDSLHSFSNFTVDLAYLEQNPTSILLRLGRHYLLQGHPFPNIVFIDSRLDGESPGIDVGGLRRHLISTLFENLVQNEELFAGEKAKKLPILAYDNQEQDKKDYFRTIGRLFAISLNSSLLTGSHFDQNLFIAIHWIINNSNPRPDHFEERVYCQLRGINHSSFHSFDPEQRISYIHDDPIVYPAILIAEEMKAALQQRTLPEGLEFQRAIQGIEITSEKLLDKVTFKQGSEKQRSDMQRFFRNWATTTDSKCLVTFVKFATGSQSLGNNNISIKLFPSQNSELLPISHSCFNSLEMPIYPNQETFNNKIELAFEGGAEGFQFA